MIASAVTVTVTGILRIRCLLFRAHRSYCALVRVARIGPASLFPCGSRDQHRGAGPTTDHRAKIGSRTCYLLQKGFAHNFLFHFSSRSSNSNLISLLLLSFQIMTVVFSFSYKATPASHHTAMVYLSALVGV